MTIFELFVFSCIYSRGFTGEVMSMTCSWSRRELYLTEQSCGAAGEKLIGTPILSFDMPADGPTKIEKSKCLPLGVLP